MAQPDRSYNDMLSWRSNLASYKPSLEYKLFMMLQRLNDLSRNYCERKRPIKFWQLARALQVEIDLINNLRATGTPKLFVDERWFENVTYGLNYMEFFLQFSPMEMDDPNAPMSNFQLAVTHTDLVLAIPSARSCRVYDSTLGVFVQITRAVHSQFFPPESQHRALFAFCLHTDRYNQMEEEELIVGHMFDPKTRERRFTYIQTITDNGGDAMLSSVKRENSFILHGTADVLLLEDEDSNFCHCQDCRSRVRLLLDYKRDYYQSESNAEV